MPYLSKQSKANLNTCCKELQTIFYTAIDRIDFSVNSGYRGKDEQNKLYADGKTKLLYPYSKHNKIPSQAIDVSPCPIDNDIAQRYIDLSIVMKKIASEKGINIKWGGDFQNDNKESWHYETT